MAKDLGLISNGRKKLGNVVLQRNNVQRQRVYNIRNPKTRGQIAARVVTATLTGMAAGLKCIVDHSFETVPYGAKSLAHFRKLNAKTLMAKAKEELSKPTIDCNGAFLPKGFSGVLPNEVIISSGSLPYNNAYLPYFYPNESSIGSLNMMAGVESVDITGMSMSEWIWYFFGLRPGQQLTWVLVGTDKPETPVYESGGYDADDYGTQNRSLHHPAVKICRLVIKEAKDFTYPNVNINLGLNGFLGNDVYGCIDWNKTDHIFSELLLAQEMYTWEADAEQHPTHVSMGMATIPATDAVHEWEDEVYAAAGIVSEKVGGGWLRTTSKLILSEYQRKRPGDQPDEYTSAGQGLNIHDAIDSWLTSSLAQSDRYLNEG